MRLCLILLCTAGLLGVSSPSRAQNLIENPGFEQFDHCPQALGNLQSDVHLWSTPTGGSTDFFHRCSTQMGVPENFNGRQSPAQGDGYAGFYAYAPGNYREYLQTRLRRPLREGQEYTFSVTISLSERSNYALTDFGILLCEQAVSATTRKVLTKRHWYAQKGNSYHLVVLKGDAFLSDTERWMKLSQTFVAKGKERYLIFGNFKEDARSRKRSTGRDSNKGAYYYVDDFRLEATGPQVASSIPEFIQDSLYTLPSLLFEFDAFSLSDVGKAELLELGAFLRVETWLDLELLGHTDALGTPGYNLQLSERRCRVVAGFLEDQGVDPSRIHWKGYGASRPVAGNETSGERRRNRRVEFMLRTARDSLPTDEAN
jgi:outer membrane protein OmpA-like peptidoglycan-associated protein